MIVQLYADGILVYDNRLAEESGQVVTSILIEESLNKGGLATITLSPNHPQRGAFAPFRAPVEIYRDGKLRWRGRPLPPTDDFYGQSTIVCEGELCWLRDAVHRPHLYQSDPATIFVEVITVYNAAVEPWKRFSVGTVTVTDPNDYIRLETINPETVLDTVNKLITRCGGYVLFDSAPDGTRRINWYAELPYNCSQRIRYGYNLTGYSRQSDVTGFATRIIPYGAMNEDGQRITIDVDGRDYVEDAEAVAQRGVIEAAVIYDDITLPENLLARATQDVAITAQIPEIIQLSAIDLSRQDLSIDAFALGQRVPAESVPHQLSGTYDLTALREDLVDPQVGSVTLTREAANLVGSSSGTLTGSMSDQGKEISAKPSTAEVLEFTAVLTAGFLGAKGGCVRLLDTDGDHMPDEIYVADNPDPALAVKVWRWNYAGWAGSKTGYNGPFTALGTLDGIYADTIIAGTLRGVTIIGEAGTIGGYTLSKDSLSVTIRIDYPDFTDADLQKMTDYYTGVGTLTDAEKVKYDVNLNGRIDSGDATAMRGMMAGTLPNYSVGNVTINSADPRNTITLRITEGYRAGESVSIGLGGLTAPWVSSRSGFAVGDTDGVTQTVTIGDKTLKFVGGIFAGTE